MATPQTHTHAEISIATSKSEPIVIKGDLGGLHTDSAKLQQLLDLLGVPKGTEVRVTTQASSMIVR
jgi:hypothetical protein